MLVPFFLSLLQGQVGLPDQGFCHGLSASHCAGHSFNEHFFRTFFISGSELDVGDIDIAQSLFLPLIALDVLGESDHQLQLIVVRFMTKGCPRGCEPKISYSACSVILE